MDLRGMIKMSKELYKDFIDSREINNDYRIKVYNFNFTFSENISKEVLNFVIFNNIIYEQVKISDILKSYITYLEKQFNIRYNVKLSLTTISENELYETYVIKSEIIEKIGRKNEVIGQINYLFKVNKYNYKVEEL
jgi:hypothetical protein